MEINPTALRLLKLIGECGFGVISITEFKTLFLPYSLMSFDKLQAILLAQPLACDRGLRRMHDSSWVWCHKCLQILALRRPKQEDLQAMKTIRSSTRTGDCHGYKNVNETLKTNIVVSGKMNLSVED